MRVREKEEKGRVKLRRRFKGKFEIGVKRKDIKRELKKIGYIFVERVSLTS